MKVTRVRVAVALGLLAILTFSGLGPVGAQQGQQKEPEIYLRLKYATFDPLVSQPAVKANLRVDAYPAGGEGPYIVQFRGPIQDGWRDEIQSLGGHVMGYLPDYAFLVWMNGDARTRMEGWNDVRWVGLYEPAYKLSPDLDRTKPLYRVVLFEGTDLKAIESRLQSLNTPTTSVPGEQFTLVLPDGNVEAVAAWPEVLWIENQPFYQLTNDVAGPIMNAPTAWSSSFTGSGMTVTVADTGIDSGDTSNMHPDFAGRVAHISSWPVQDDGCSGCCIANVNANDGAADLDSGHGTHVLGSVAGNGTASSGQIKGLAYQSTLTFQAIEQWTTFTPLCGGGQRYYLSGLPNDLSPLFQEAYNWGSRIHSDSWGSDAAGQYTADSQTVDQFVWDHPNMVILFAAGNYGVDANKDGYVDQGSIGSPATAKNCISVGASESERSTGGYNPGGPCWTWGNPISGCWPSDYPANPTRDDRLSDTREHLAAFSSRGPTDDGRIKPDVVAPGTNIVSTRSRFISGYGWGPYSNSSYMYFGGTSMATPLTAGAATLVREYYAEGRGQPNPSAALIKATLINSAVDITGYGNPSQEAGKPIPNNHEGWGRVDVGAATSGSREFHDWDKVGTGITDSYSYQIGLSVLPLKVTLAWTDYPASPPTGGLVNNLNLRVTAPDGTKYWGNRFSNGWSVSGGSADTVNNVESVYVQTPAPGTWKIDVIGANIPMGPQPFAFVVTGWLGAPPVFDNTVYMPVSSKNH